MLGPMTLSGFEHVWFLLFLVVVLGLIGLYVVVQLARHKRMLRFANMELLESVAPKRPSRWRHVPAILLVLSLLLLTVAMAGPGRVQVAQTELSMLSAVAVPPVICQDKVAISPAVIVAGETLRLSVKGTVTVSVLVALVRSDEVAVSV